MAASCVVLSCVIFTALVLMATEIKCASNTSKISIYFLYDFLLFVQPTVFGVNEVTKSASFA